MYSLLQDPEKIDDFITVFKKILKEENDKKTLEEILFLLYDKIFPLIWAGEKNNEAQINIDGYKVRLKEVKKALNKNFGLKFSKKSSKEKALEETKKFTKWYLQKRNKSHEGKLAKTNEKIITLFGSNLN